ncbi:hypothetical protein AQUCO_03500175v1 [Aquilegia coerulea]|uniref:BHLH domain-containing protein n=1 Tax=Aquilegia coerulea TaxID=218851 RepID=A0A2G5CWI7_AQUCA|nr:hypothetical protein AQUCO_03500175v1 [Aquilegia coerulea]
MSQCVPNWDLDENSTSIRVPFHPNSNMNDAKASDVTDPTLDYEVAELTWENGQLGLHGLGPPRVIGGKPISSKYTWEKPRASGTLESIVNQAVQLGPCEAPIRRDEFVPWFDHQRAIGAAGNMTMDALVPSSNSIHFVHNSAKRIADPNQGVGTCVTRKSTRVESCGGTTSFERGKEREERIARKRARVQNRVGMAREGCSRNQSVSVSETFGRESRQVGADSCEMDLDTGFTSTSLDSDTNLNTIDDRDSVSHTRPQARTEEDNKSTQNDKSTISTKRSRAAAIHNQSERKRRDKINQRMKTLQKLVPNSSKTDKASMLDEVIEYLKTLQAQVHMMSRMSMPQMMMPMTMQQQLQMTMMAQMGMAGMGMGMGMGGMMDHMNSIGRPNIPGMPHQVLNPAAFMSMAPWDGTNDRVPGSSALMPDPMASFLAACQTQPMTMDAYSRMGALYQQIHQQVPNSKS